MTSGKTFELGTDGPTVIVVGVDSSPASLRALAYASGLARRQRAELVCVYVRSAVILSTVPSTAYVGGIDPGTWTEEDLDDDVRRSVADECQRWSIGARVIVRDGDPFSELTAVAEQVQADMIVLGSSSGIGHRLFGGLASRLARCKRWPVMVVP